MRRRALTQSGVSVRDEGAVVITQQVCELITVSRARIGRRLQLKRREGVRAVRLNVLVSFDHQRCGYAFTALTGAPTRRALTRALRLARPSISTAQATRKKITPSSQS